MKYLKKFENVDIDFPTTMTHHEVERLNKSTLNYDKIYTYIKRSNIGKKHIDLVGKFDRNYVEAGSLFKGIVINTNFESSVVEVGDRRTMLVRGYDWVSIKEATPEEIEQYELLSNTNKYNL